jgi:hypothetical protein
MSLAAQAQEPVTIPSKEVSTGQPSDHASSVNISTRIDYSSGKYGQSQSTDILVGLTSLGVTFDDFQVSASLPYLNITSPAYVVVGPGGVPVAVTPKAGASDTTRSGWGDLS